MSIKKLSKENSPLVSMQIDAKVLKMEKKNRVQECRMEMQKLNPQ